MMKLTFFSISVTGVACDPLPAQDGYFVEMGFRVGDGEFARYKCPPNTHFASNATARPEVRLMCRHIMSTNKWKYFYEDGTTEFDAATHNWETCGIGKSR